MIELYDFKIIKSGTEIEVYEYKTQPILKGYTRRKRQSTTSKNQKREAELIELMKQWGDDEGLTRLEKKQKKKTRFSISRTRTNIRRLTNANPHLNKFLTLTFAQSTTDVAKANKLFNTAMKRILRAQPDFVYIAVIEFQKDTDYYGKKKAGGGSVHYHLLCNINLPDTKNMEERFKWERRFAFLYWKNGFIKVKDVNAVTNMGAYFCKYLSKDMFDQRMFGKKKFFCSRQLNKPVEMTGEEAKRFFHAVVSTHKAVYESTFSNEYVGTVNYSAYSLKN